MSGWPASNKSGAHGCEPRRRTTQHKNSDIGGAEGTMKPKCRQPPLEIVLPHPHSFGSLLLSISRCQSTEQQLCPILLDSMVATKHLRSKSAAAASSGRCMASVDPTSSQCRGDLRGDPLRFASLCRLTVGVSCTRFAHSASGVGPGRFARPAAGVGSTRFAAPFAEMLRAYGRPPSKTFRVPRTVTRRQKQTFQARTRNNNNRSRNTFSKRT